MNLAQDEAEGCRVGVAGQPAIIAGAVKGDRWAARLAAAITAIRGPWRRRTRADSDQRLAAATVGKALGKECVMMYDGPVQSSW